MQGKDEVPGGATMIGDSIDASGYRRSKAVAQNIGAAEISHQ